MDQSPYVKHLRTIIWSGTCLDTAKCSVNYIRLGCTVIIWSLVLLSHALTITDTKSGLPFRATYESFAFLSTLAQATCMLMHRQEITTLVSINLQPFYDFGAKMDPGQTKILGHYVKWINRVGRMYIYYNVLFLCCFLMAFVPLISLYFSPKGTLIQDLPLPVGRIPFHTESYIVYGIMYTIFAYAIASGGMFHASWQSLIIFSGLKIQTQLKILSKAVTHLEERISDHFNRTFKRSVEEKHLKLEGIAISFLVQSIQRHQEIIEFVKLFNKCFRTTLLVLFQSAIIIIAVLVSQIFGSSEYKPQELLARLNFIAACLIVLGIFNMTGQIVINESEILFRSLYECEWLGKSRQFQNNLRIMMTVATRPLTLSVGGLYPLSMESYRKIMAAVYSYINILLSVQKGK